MTMLIGIDVGGTNLRLGVVEYTFGQQPRLIEEMRFQADFSKLCKSSEQTHIWPSILNTIVTAIEHVRTKFPTVAAVGIGFPGFIDPSTQRISQSPNLPGLSNVDLSADLSRILQLPVLTENDALAAAYGEYINLLPQHPQLKNLIYLGLGTGVGGGLILNGQPFQGQHGVAMEVGHIIVQQNGRLCGCGNHGCMEQYASASGVVLSYTEATSEECHADEISDRAQQGDNAAVVAYNKAGSALAQALAHILKVIDVTDVVVGGGMSAAWNLMSKAFQQQLETDLIAVLRGKVHVNISNMGDQAGIIGAAMLAHQKVID